MFLLEWREFPSAPCLAEKKNLMTARVSMLLKSSASLTSFRAGFFPGRTKDLTARHYCFCNAVFSIHGYVLNHPVVRYTYGSFTERCHENGAKLI